MKIHWILFANRAVLFYNNTLNRQCGSVESMATDVKNQIAETFVKFATKSGIDKVTINAIVTECGISRQAFYYYYQDIVDVARYVMREKLKVTLVAGEEAEDPEKAVRIFAEDIVRQFPVISIMLNSKLRGEMELLLISGLKEFFRTIFNRRNCGRDLDRQQIEFQADFIACGMTAYAMEHCNEARFDSAELSKHLWDMLKRTYGE